jgi:multiple sugar transport system substrate-binding protein
MDIDGAGVTKDEMIRIISFIEESRQPAPELGSLQVADPFWRMVLLLIRRHLEGKPVTITSLAASSEVPYGTAMRRIQEMLCQGLIVRRSRTRTGRSFFLHPGQELLEDFEIFALHVKRLVARTFGFGDHLERGTADFYFGGAYMAARVIPAPSIMPNGLSAKDTLRLVTHSDPTFMAMEQVARPLEQTLGGLLKLTGLGLDELHAELVRNSKLPDSRYDLIGVDLPWIGEFASTGILRPLDDLIDEDGFSHSDFHSAGWEAAEFADHQYGVPIQTTPELLFYRTDLFSDAGLKPPTTTDEVLECARALHAPARKRFGIAWNGRRGTPLGHTFIQVMAAFGQPILSLKRLGNEFDARLLGEQQRHPCLLSPAARQTAEYLIELLKVSPPDVLEMQWNDRIRAYREGRVAMTYGWTIRASAFELDPKSPARGNTGYVPHPRGPDGYNVSPIGGLVLSIPANLAPDRQALAWRCMRWLASAEVMKVFVQHGSVVSPRFSVSADPEIRSAFPIIAAVDRMAQLGQLQLWPRPPVPEFNALAVITGNIMHDMLCGALTVDQALVQCQEQLQTLLSGQP